MLLLTTSASRAGLRHAMRALCLLGICLFASATSAVEPVVGDDRIATAEREFAAALAESDGLDAAAVLATLGKARYQQAVIDAISHPAEAKPWKDYRPLFVNERRTADGVAFFREHAALLARVTAETGVPAELVVTILGIETNYGRNTGRYRVLDALTTLAFYYPPRAEFFRNELRQLFRLQGPRFPYALDSLTGSYAGAMGACQFLPSSIAQFARDGDGDGKIDLWNSWPDIAFSVANYFVAHGWEKDGPIALPASVAPHARKIDPAGLTPVYPLQQLGEWGYAPLRHLDPMTPATLLELDGANGREVWITFENFYAISRYNHSPLYSLAVYQLSQAIAAAAVANP